jgi:hypothetical protein
MEMNRMYRRYFSALIGVLMVLVAGRSVWGATVLMLTNNNGSLTAVESNLKGLLESAGHTVNTLWDGDSQANYTAAFANNDVVYIPSDVSTADMGTKLRTCTIGVINEIAAYMDDLGMCTSDGTTTSTSSLNISTNSHYITSPFSTGFFSMGSTSYTTSRAAGTTASGATVLATAGGVNSIIAVDTGATLANTIVSNSTAAGRRVQMPVQVGVIDTSTLTANMQTLLQRLVIWAALGEGKLEAYWKLNETSGTSAADSSGNSRTGTVTGTSSWVAAVLNNGFSFNGSTKIQATGLMGNPRNVSVAAWANLTTADSVGSEVVSLGDHFALRLDDAGVAKAMFYNGSTYVTASLSVPYVGTGWHHFAAVFDDGHDTLKLYVDGTLAVTTSTTSSVSWSGLGANTVVGRHGNGTTTSDFTGTLDDVKVYSYAITATEVAQLYGLIGRWRLNETSGTSASDATTFNRAGTLTGAASWSSDCGGMGVFDFNGSSHVFTVSNTSDFQPTTMLSISAWIKGDAWGSGSNANAILRKGDANPNNYALQISDGRVELLLDGSDTSGIRGNTVLNTGQWYFVAATWDGTTGKIYVNGVLDNSPGTAKAAPIGTDTRPVYLGGRAGGDYFDGMIRDIRLYNRPLTAAELVQGAGIVGWWKFAEGSGTSAADSSGLGNNATLAASATWTSDCAGNNNALLTNGTASGIASTNASFNPPDVGTLAFWLRSTGAPAGTARILGLGGDWELRQQTNGTIVSDLCGDGSTNICTVTALTEVGRWYHVAFTFDSSNDTYGIYVNGQLEASGTNPVNMVQQTAAVLSFGTRTGATEYWSGALRDVRIYNRKLCPSEIEDLYGLVGHWKMDETSGTVAADSSGMGRNGTVIGTATWTAGKVNNCIQLNGTNRVEVSSLMGAPKNVTLAGWANLTAGDTGGAEIVSIGDYIALRLNEGSVSKVFFYNGSSWVSVSASQTFAGTGWHHFAGVFSDDQNFCKLYIDGTEVASTSTSVTLSYSGLGTKTVIGANGNAGTTTDFNGKLDDIRIYSRVLCPTEIQELKGMGFGGVKIIKWVENQ